MKMILTVLFAVLATASAVPKFQNCEKNPVVTLEVTDFPEPLVIKSGAELKVNFKVVVKQDLPDTLYAKISMKRHALWWWSIPCIKDVGSCEYKVTCDLIKKWAKTDKLPHPCPAPAGITQRSFSITLPDIPYMIKKIGGGEYKLKAEIFTRSNGNGQRLGCAETKLNVKT